MKKAVKPVILLIDDDEKLAKLLSEFFNKFDLTLLSEITPSKGLKTLSECEPDLILLDVMLPEMNGFKVCEEIRKKYNTPIIMLTARGDVNDRVNGLALGADDYLPKPFDPRELVARIDIILSRMNQKQAPDGEGILQYSQLTINTISYEVSINKKQIELTAKEYALLLLMSANPDKVFSRDDIMNEVSGIDSDLFSRSVDILVSRLRNKLKPLDYIQTVWGKGYKFTT